MNHRHFGLLGNNESVVAFILNYAVDHGCDCDPPVEIERCPDCSDVQEINVQHSERCKITLVAWARFN